MARTQRDLKGWTYILTGDDAETTPGTPRRSRRNSPRKAALESLYLRREEDDLELRVGDIVIIQDGDSEAEVVLIKDIALGVINIIDVTVVLLLLLKYVDEKVKSDAQEVFLTPYASAIRLSEVVAKANVVSEAEYSQIVIDESNRDSTFVCRRGCDTNAEKFTEVLDFREWHNEFKKNTADAMNRIWSEVMPTEYKSPFKKVETPRKPSKVTQKLKELESDGEDEYEEEEEEAETSDSEVEEEEEVTPKKRKRSSVSVSPTKRRLYVRSKTTAESLRKQFLVDPGRSTPSAVDPSSQAFKEVRARLHTSPRLVDLPCRINEFTTLYMNLENAINEKTGCCVYVSGTPGVGKTATVREVVAHLKEGVEQNLVGPFEYLEINGLKLLSPNTSYEILWEKISGLKVSALNAALLLEEYFRNEKGEDRKPLVVLMDELDQIVTAKQNVMYNFFNWPTYAKSNLVVIAVANTMDLPERVLSNKISSRLGLRRIQFIGYTFQQLGEIIANRLVTFAKESGKNVEIHPDAIGFASRKVANVSGDARRALNICRRAVEIAEKEYLESGNQSDHYTVTISHISKAINETTHSPTAQLIASLSFASKVVLVAVLLRMKRSGLARNSMGDIIEEIKNTLALQTVPNTLLEKLKATFHDVLFSGAFVAGFGTNVRVHRFKHIITELVENGILLHQNVRSERHAMISLSVSEDEVVGVLRQDGDVARMM